MSENKITSNINNIDLNLKNLKNNISKIDFKSSQNNEQMTTKKNMNILSQLQKNIYKNLKNKSDKIEELNNMSFTNKQKLLRKQQKINTDKMYNNKSAIETIKKFKKKSTKLSHYTNQLQVYELQLKKLQDRAIGQYKIDKCLEIEDDDLDDWSIKLKQVVELQKQQKQKLYDWSNARIGKLLPFPVEINKMIVGHARTKKYEIMIDDYITEYKLQVKYGFWEIIKSEISGCNKSTSVDNILENYRDLKNKSRQIHDKLINARQDLTDNCYVYIEDIIESFEIDLNVITSWRASNKTKSALHYGGVGFGQDNLFELAKYTKKQTLDKLTETLTHLINYTEIYKDKFQATWNDLKITGRSSEIRINNEIFEIRKNKRMNRQRHNDLREEFTNRINNWKPPLLEIMNKKLERKKPTDINYIMNDIDDTWFISNYYNWWKI